MPDEPAPSPGTRRRLEENVVIQTILTRQSMRETFSERPISNEALEVIIRCGLAAPSSKNAQPWRFHVVSARPLLRDLAGLVDNSESVQEYVPHDPDTGKPWPHYQSSVRASATLLRACSAAVFVENRGVFSRGRDTLASPPYINMPGQLIGYGFEFTGIGAAIQNMLLAAHALGVHAAFMGDVLIAEEGINERLDIGGDLSGALAFGYAEKAIPPRSPRDGAEHVTWH